MKQIQVITTPHEKRLEAVRCRKELRRSQRQDHGTSRDCQNAADPLIGSISPIGMRKPRCGIIHFGTENPRWRKCRARYGKIRTAIEKIALLGLKRTSSSNLPLGAIPYQFKIWTNKRPRMTGIVSPRFRSSKPAPFETCHPWHVSSASPSGVRFPLPHFGTIKPPFGGFYVPIGGDDGNRTRVPQGSPYACTSIADVRLRDPDGNGAKTPYRERVPIPDYR